ncbi:MAG: LIC_10091 family protein [Gemmatimonadaceae bacterium]
MDIRAGYPGVSAAEQLQDRDLGSVRCHGLRSTLKCKRDRVGGSLRVVVRFAIVTYVFAAAAFSPAAAVAQAAPVTRTQTRESEFAARVARLSEPAGYFDSDNLISNESSYLHPVAALRALGVRGGAYIGVGPDQSFSYIAAIRPRIAYLIDIRRDNMIQHLMFKALFERSRNRLEYLCRWLGYAVPPDVERWTGRQLDAIIAHLDSTPPNEQSAAAERAEVAARVRGYGVALDARDFATLERFHTTFQTERLDLRFTSLNRPPRAGYPTLRELMLERDLHGKRASYLTSESDWLFLKSLQARNMLIPVVGDLAGQHALKAIGRDIAVLGTRVAAFYVSNVEQYVWRDGTFSQYADNTAALPRDSRSVLIRSYFGRNFGTPHPLARDGGMSLSTQLMQSLNDFAARRSSGGWSSYWDLVTLGAIDLASPRLP